MTIHIIGDANRDVIYCTGSFTKLLTTYVCLSRLSENFDLATILDDDNFLDTICKSPDAKRFLTLFQRIIGSKFSIHDICSYYAGLPYTFDVTPDEIECVDAGASFKHHSVMDEKAFLYLCEHYITPVYKKRCKFHYSELSIIFLGYLTEKIFQTSMETLYHQYVIGLFNLKNSVFSRVKPPHVRTIDFSDKYDYPAIAVQDHGYFCYSNGFYTTLNDEKIIIEGLLTTPVFNFMIDIKHARAASNRLMNGLTIEMRMVNDDRIIGYEGLSYSGCNIWAYSLKQKTGYLTLIDSEEDAYTVIYDGQFGYHDFDKVPDHTQTDYQHFIAAYQSSPSNHSIPEEFQGTYHRVRINDFDLKDNFTVNKDSIIIRNPDPVTFSVTLRDGVYRVVGKDGVHGSRVGFSRAKSGRVYMDFDGNLYKKNNL